MRGWGERRGGIGAQEREPPDITYHEAEYCNNTDGDCAGDIRTLETHWDTTTLSLTIYVDNGKMYKVRASAWNNKASVRGRQPHPPPRAADPDRRSAPWGPE